MSWKPHTTTHKGLKLHNNVGALLISGVELHLVPQGKIADPDAGARKSPIGPEDVDFEVDFGSKNVMLMSMKFKSPMEARRRAAVLAMRTFDAKHELHVPVMTHAMLCNIWASSLAKSRER